MASAPVKINEDDTAHIVKLKNSATFPIWDWEVKILFNAKKLMDIVEGKETLAMCGRDTDKITKWKQHDAIAKQVFMKTVDREAKLHLMTSETSKEMYDTLVKIYKKDTEQEKCLLLQEFYNFKFDNSKDVHYNFSKMQNIVYQLKLVDEEVSENMFMS